MACSLIAGIFLKWNCSGTDATAEGGSYLGVGGSGGMLPRKILKNKEQNTATWGYLGGFNYTKLRPSKQSKPHLS